MQDVYRLHPLKYRSVWISDVHLGSRGCKDKFLLDFLNSIECEQLFLVGDILDLWSLRSKGFYWPQSHNDLIRKVLGKARHGTRVIYVPGNHDEDFREFAGAKFGNIEIHLRYIHHTADNRRLLVVHGDEFDSAIRCNRLVRYLGDRAYDLLLYMNRWLNIFRRHMGFPYWSISTYIKSRVSNAARLIEHFEQAVAHAARREGVDGLVCGHIHHPEIRRINGVLYCNTGDWVENCSAMVEHHDGSLEILHWSDVVKALKYHPASTALKLQDKKIA